MKSPILPIVVLGAAALGLCSTAAAESPAISLHVEQSNHTEMTPKVRWTKTHSRKLHVFVTNDSDAVRELKVKNVIFGRDMLTHDIVKAGDGENPLEVKPHSTANVDTVEAKCTEDDQHFDPKAKKMSEASGATIAGAGVQIFEGDKLVAEWYEPETMKEQWSKAQPMIGSKAAAPLPPKGKK